MRHKRQVKHTVHIIKNHRKERRKCWMHKEHRTQCCLMDQWHIQKARTGTYDNGNKTQNVRQSWSATSSCWGSQTDTSKPAGPRPLILYSQERRSREQQSQYPKEWSGRESGVVWAAVLQLQLFVGSGHNALISEEIFHKVSRIDKHVHSWLWKKWKVGFWGLQP